MVSFILVLTSFITLLQNLTTGQISKHYGYGLDPKNYKEHKLVNAGPHNGLRILLNVNQPDYCGASRKWSGAGFKVIVHDPSVKPWFVLEPTLSFSPGFDTNVVLKPTVFDRHTENLGRSLDLHYHNVKMNKTLNFSNTTNNVVFN